MPSRPTVRPSKSRSGNCQPGMSRPTLFRLADFGEQHRSQPMRQPMPAPGNCSAINACGDSITCLRPMRGTGRAAKKTGKRRAAGHRPAECRPSPLLAATPSRPTTQAEIEPDARRHVESPAGAGARPERAVNACGRQAQACLVVRLAQPVVIAEGTAFGRRTVLLADQSEPIGADAVVCAGG